MSVTKEFSREEIISIENGDFIVSEARVLFANFQTWLEVHNLSLKKLTNDLDELNSKVIEFIGFINRFNRDNGTITLLPSFRNSESESTFHGFFNVDVAKFDADYNYVLPNKVRTLKEFMNPYLFSISMSPTPYNTATSYDFKSFVKAIQSNLNIE